MSYPQLRICELICCYHKFHITFTIVTLLYIKNIDNSLDFFCPAAMDLCEYPAGCRRFGEHIKELLHSAEAERGVLLIHQERISAYRLFKFNSFSIAAIWTQTQKTSIAVLSSSIGG